jgi:response regulator RpfG family c-di-GMP phosphodiesterase
MADEILILGSRAFGEDVASSLRAAAPIVRTPEDAVRAVRERSVTLVLAEAGPTGQEEATRSLIVAARPSCRVLFLGSVGQFGSGTDRQDGSRSYVLRGRELASLVADTGSPRSPGTGKKALIKVLEMVMSLDEAGDRYFAGFTNKVTRITGALADEMGIDPADREDIITACVLRDIGKAGISDELVQQPEALTPSEIEHMQQHVLWSVRLLENVDFDGKVLPIVRHHHERYDGSGYPDGLKGGRIPVGARIIAAAEAFVAMTSDRPHRPARSVGEALDEMMGRAGTQFDPEIVEALMKLLQRASAADLSGRKVVLIVDPDQGSRRLLRMRLLNEGYDLVVTDELSEESGLPLPEAPDVVVFDASDGGGEALRWLNRFRQRAADRPVPFAVMVPDDEPAIRMRALDHGVDDVIVKSSSLEEIAARIKNILVREAAREQQLGGRRTVGVRGHVQAFPVSEIIQMLSMGDKTASVRLTSRDRSGSLWFRDGRLVHAEDGTNAGIAAFHALVEWDDAEFLIQHGRTPLKETIDADPTALLLKHCGWPMSGSEQSVMDQIAKGVEEGLGLDRPTQIPFGSQTSNDR